MTKSFLSRGRLSISLAMSALLAVGATLASSCNLIVDASSDSCESDDDCVNLPNTACDTEQQVCVSLDKCKANSECASNEICRPFSPRTCVPLLQGNCQAVYSGDTPATQDLWRSDNAMLVGITAPLLAGSPDEATGVSIANGAKLAVDEFNKDNGVEGERPLALIICDDQGERGPAEENGRTLAAIGAQAIIGPAFSGQTLDTANGTPDGKGAERPGTVDNDVLLISTSATSPLVTGIDDVSPKCVAACGNDTQCQSSCPGLVWRTSPSDEIQGRALSAYFTAIEGKIAARGGVTPARTDLTVFILYKDDPYGDLLSQVVRTTLQIGGTPATLLQGTRFYRRVYTDTDPNTDGVQPEAAAIQEALTSGADAIFLMGTGEVASILSDIEANWELSGNNPEDRPFYFFADGGLSDATSVAAGTARNRVRGTIPGTQSANFNAFTGAYLEKFPAMSDAGGPNVFGAAGAYDAVYLLGYSSVAAGNAPLTSAQLAVGFSKLTSGNRIDVGTTGIGPANSALQQGGTIDFVGASGELQFDPKTGEAPSEIQIWCIPSATQGGIFSNIYYDGASIVNGSLDPGDAGTFSCPF